MQSTTLVPLLILAFSTVTAADASEDAQSSRHDEPATGPLAVSTFPSLFILNDLRVQEELALGARERALIDQLTADYLSGTARNRTRIRREPMIGKEEAPGDNQALAGLQRQLITELCQEAEAALTAEQRERVREIQIQLKGVLVLLDPEVQRHLQLTGEQRKEIHTVLVEFGREGDRLPAMAQSETIARQKIRRSFGDLQERYLEQALELLRPAQRTRFYELRGRRMAYRIYETTLQAKVKARPQYESAKPSMP